MKCFLLFGFLTLLISCSSTNDSTKETQSTADLTANETYTQAFNFDTLTGVYTGDFGDGNISLVLSFVNEKKAIGYDVHKGLKRNISGSVTDKNDFVELILNEPGDNPYDGVFVLKISKVDFSVDAIWTANDPKLRNKKFKLTKKIIKQRDEKAKPYYEGGVFTEEDFIENFSYCSYKDGDIEFIEDGTFTYSYYPTTDEVERKEQLETCAGSWKFNKDKTLTLEWGRNAPFQLKITHFKFVNEENEMPRFAGANGEDITLAYY